MSESGDHAAGTSPADLRRPLPRALRRPLAVVAVAEQTVGAALLAVLLVLVLLQTVMRFLPIGGWVWTGELARFCLVWLAFALSGYLMEREGHITLEVVDFVVPAPVLRWIKAFANAVVALTCLGFALAAYAMVSSGTLQTSPAMGLPLPLVYVIPLVAFVLTGVRAALGVVWRPPGEGQRDRPGGVAPTAAGEVAP